MVKVKQRFAAVTLAVVALAAVAACSSGPGRKAASLSPPEWLHGSWTVPPRTEPVLEVSVDNWVDHWAPINVKEDGYDRVSDERATDIDYTFTYRLVQDDYEGTLTYMVRKTATAAEVQTVFKPTHPTHGDGTGQYVPIALLLKDNGS